MLIVSQDLSSEDKVVKEEKQREKEKEFIDAVNNYYGDKKFPLVAAFDSYKSLLKQLCEMRKLAQDILENGTHVTGDKKLLVVEACNGLDAHYDKSVRQIEFALHVIKNYGSTIYGGLRIFQQLTEVRGRTGYQGRDVYGSGL